MCQIFAAYVRKTARLRDKADLLVREINLFADTETPNMKYGLKSFAEELAKLQDYRQAEVERLEAKVVEPLKSYGAIIKLKREDLKVTLSARNREAKQMTQLEKTRQRNPSDRQIISQVGDFRTNNIKAESELQRATMDAARISRQLEETIDTFEKQKIKDLKKTFCEFVNIEMSFHAKALEIYTAAYQHIDNIDEEEDIQVFRSSLHPPDYQSRLDVVRANSKLTFDRTSSTKQISQISSNQKKKMEEEEEEDEEDELDITDDEN
ncbi:protein FAM92A isoform X5 [Rhinatrema bivittatum]|nr:protein FAM92A isoform X5 [Rhinatrema bivittatum]XP_029447547.1 protein FAM92A isoform X5 [Rhinatrema bivittatum]